MRGSTSRLAILWSVGIALAPGCSQDPSGPERAPTDRVFRLVAVAGDGQEGPAGLPLPARLEIRALDLEGRAVPQVPIRWRTDHGGVPTPASTTTDSLGEATTTWSLGSGSSRQTLVAAVAGTDEGPTVTFQAVVPVADVAFEPLSGPHWAGDLVSPEYVARDANGTELTNPAVPLVSVGPAILTRLSDRTFRANRWGVARITAEGVSRSDTLEVPVLPIVRAHVRSVGPEDVTESSTVSVAADGWRVQGPSPGDGGSLELRLDTLPSGSSVEVLMTPGPDSLHFPVLFPLDTSKFQQRVTLMAVPRDWTIPAGAHAGRRIRLSMNLLAGNPLRTPVPYVRGNFATDGIVVWWPGQPMKKLLWINVEESQPGLLNMRRDSAALWATLDSVEHSAGLDLFESDPDRAVAEYGSVEVRVRAQPSALIWGQRRGAHSFGILSFPEFRGSSGTGAWEVVQFEADTWVAVRSPATFTDVAVWETLAMHFHSFDRFKGSKPGWCLFESVKADCARYETPRYSPEDVAAMGLTHAVGRLILELREDRSQAVHPLGLASLFGERAEWLDLDPVPFQGSAPGPAPVPGPLPGEPTAEPMFGYGYEHDGTFVTGEVPCSQAGGLRLPGDVRSFLEPVIREACRG